jgi:hypothetical protein
MKRYILSLILAMGMIVGMAQTTQTHTVQRGETIESVAQKYGITVDALKAANPNAGNLFFVGMKLNIPAKVINGQDTQTTPVITSNQQESQGNTNVEIIKPTTTNVLTENVDDKIEKTSTNSTDGYLYQDYNGFAEEGTDYLFLLRPKDKVYGIHIGFLNNKYMYCGFDGIGSWADHGSDITVIGIGWGSKYKQGPLLFQGNIYPYAGLMCYQDSSMDSNNKEKWKTKWKFTYGLQASLGFGFNIYTSKKSNNHTYLTIGYYMGAAEFKTDGMVKNGNWVVGLTTDL